MFSSLWKSLSGEDEERTNRYVEHLKRLVTYFPIGSKTNYYPEYLEDINFETMILGYELNEKQIYERDHVRELSDGSVEFFLDGSGETVTAADLASFALIVPDTSELEKTLDYNSKATLGKSGQFMRGNSITLVSKATGKGTPIVDTTVLRRTLVKQGYYQDYKVVILDPRLDSLTYKEQRQKQRMKLSLACTLYTPADSHSGQCGTLIDCSEMCVSIKVPQSQPDDATLAKGMQVRISIPIAMLDRTFELTGEIYAIRSNSTVVLKLQRIRKVDEFEDLQLVDRLDLRASLAQCSHGS